MGAHGHPAPPSDVLRASSSSAKDLASNRFLVRYAANALQRRAVLGRDAGARVLAEALDSGATSAAEKLQLAGPLSEFLDADRGSDPVNALIVATLARGFAAEAAPERRSTWAAHLEASLLAKFSNSPMADQQVRAALIGQVNRPPPAQMVALLTTFAREHPDDDRAKTLVHAWRRAHPER